MVCETDYKVQNLRTNKLFAVKCNGNYKRHMVGSVIMTKAIEVVYENNVFKPLGPVEGIKENETMVAIFSRRPAKKGLRNLAGTITHDEARAMQECIDEEFEHIKKQLVK
jgi:predicted DNA-binding antitoxin AbrB/MazE fold protein